MIIVDSTTPNGGNHFVAQFLINTDIFVGTRYAVSGIESPYLRSVEELRERIF